MEFHPIQFPKQVVGEFQICFIDFINEQNSPAVPGKSLSQPAEPDVA